jgi:acetylornithine deacetylase
MTESVTGKLAALDAAVSDLSERAFGFLERLVAVPSTLGNEAEAQALVAAELERLQFEVELIPIPGDIGTRPGAGVPLVSYEGRHVVAGRNGSRSPALLINAHIDVVPAGEPALWTTDPFSPDRSDGWLVGRGAGDMKGGLAMALLAIEAAQLCEPAVTLPVAVVSVIEEECTGNGTLAAAHAGVTADAVLIPEPTGLDLWLNGIGVIWADIEVQGRAAHALVASEGVNAVDAALPVVAALRALEQELTRESGVYCAANLGTFAAGDWRSSVPAAARLGMRIGFPRSLTPAQAEARVRAALEEAARSDPWLATSPPRVTFDGFRAEGYALPEDHALVEAVAAVHASVHGAPPARSAVVSATTDARFYLNQFGIPALCYGPRARAIHAVDEAVELQSIVDGARVLGRLLLGQADR